MINPKKVINHAEISRAVMKNKASISAKRMSEFNKSNFEVLYNCVLEWYMRFYGTPKDFKQFEIVEGNIYINKNDELKKAVNVGGVYYALKDDLK